VACGGGRVLFTTPRDNMKVIFHEVMAMLQIIWQKCMLFYNVFTSPKPLIYMISLL